MPDLPGLVHDDHRVVEIAELADVARFETKRASNLRIRPQRAVLTMPLLSVLKRSSFSVISRSLLGLVGCFSSSGNDRISAFSDDHSF
jgi:hypothetical protein